MEQNTPVNSPNDQPLKSQEVSNQIFSLSHRSKNVFFALIIIVAVIISIGVYILGKKSITQLQNKQNSQVFISFSPTPVLSSTTSRSLTAAPTSFSAKVDITNWKTYYDPVLDLSFKYPENWTIKTGDYMGSLFLVAPSGYPGLCNISKDYLKNILTCTEATLRSHSPGLTLIPPTLINAPQPFIDQLQFVGPTSGLGGGCSPETCHPVNHAFRINGKTYTFITVSLPQDKSIYPYHGIAYETFEPAPVAIVTGNKSIWSKFDIYLAASDEKNFNTELSILQSISYP